ncbi:MAG TPA: NAD(+) kinase [Pseudomonadales bacterium]
MAQFRNIGLIGRLGSPQVFETLKQLNLFLLDNAYTVVLESETAAAMPGHGMQVSNKNLLGEICDLVIVVGGDGCMLGAARALAKSNVPVLGINRGHLGFLTDISPDEFETKVTEVLNGSYTSEKRFLIDGFIDHEGVTVDVGSALNDIVVRSGKSVRMIEFELYIDGQFVYSQRSDGLIISTPTGSTAYSLSGGGPIMHPRLDAIVLVPMFPHTLSSRPIVVDGKSEIKLVIGANNEFYPQVSFDGQNNKPVVPGDAIYIRKKNYQLHLIHPLNHDFYETCRSKLGWGTKL